MENVDNIADVMNWSNEQVIDAARESGATFTNSRVVGLYYEVGAEMKLANPIFSGGVEAVRFVGVDLQTGERIETWYKGATLGASSTLIPRTSVGGHSHSPVTQLT